MVILTKNHPKMEIAINNCYAYVTPLIVRFCTVFVAKNITAIRIINIIANT